MTVLVTGASGLLGTEVVAELIRAGHRVRSHVGPPGTSPVSVVAAGATDVLHADVTSAPAVAWMCRGIDEVVHLAGPPSVAASFDDPVGCANAHVMGTAHVLEAASRAGVRRFVLISSAEVYGGPGRRPVCEDAPVRPMSPYAAAKVTAESLAAAFAARDGLEVFVLRPFSVYGARSPEWSLVGRVLAAAAAAPSVQVRSLRGVRDYVHVSDLARAVQLTLQAPAAACGVYNVGTGVGTSVGELARLALVAARRDVAVVATAEVDRPAGLDSDVLVADVGRARTGLGFTAEVPLGAGLAASLEARRGCGHG